MYEKNKWKQPHGGHNHYGGIAHNHWRNHDFGESDFILHERMAA